MSLFSQTPGQRVTRDAILDSTGEVTLYELTANNQTATVESFYISVDNTATALSISVKEGSTLIFPIMNNTSITENTQIIDYHRMLRKGQKITVKAGTADHLAVSVVLFQSAGNGGGNGGN